MTETPDIEVVDNPGAGRFEARVAGGVAFAFVRSYIRRHPRLQVLLQGGT